MDSLHSELDVSPPAASPLPPRAKSPPLAFERTSNDALAPLISPSHASPNHNPLASPSSQRSDMGIFSPQSEQDLQAIVNQQANAIQKLHEAFAAERQVWTLERDRLYQRIASLEQLLKTGNHYSPAKSPIISPSNGATSREGSITSPQSRAMSTASRLPVISEDENITPLSQRREGAPRAIEMPGRPPIPVITGERYDRSERASSVSFDGSVMVEEIPVSPPTTARNLSPLPPSNRALAGHTPLKAPRPPTPPAQNLALDGSEDTPTRNNTHLNAFLTRTTSEEEDQALKGPLNLPELPHKPEDSNFTLDALSKRLEQVAQSPEESRPAIFAQPSPGMMSPSEPAPLAEQPLPMESEFQPAAHSPAVSPSSQPPPPTNEVVNGVRLKKKASTNFGAPFGQLGGFRKLS